MAETDFFEEMSSMDEREQILKKISKMPSNYVGSKRRLLGHIYDATKEYNIKFDSVLDSFSGSGLVSLLFKHMGKTVYSNDLLTSSAISAVSLLENDTPPLSTNEIKELCTRTPSNKTDFVLSSYKDKFFTERECIFLDNYRRNVEELYGPKFFCGLDLLNKATLSSIPNSNFTVTGNDLKKIRGVHDENTPFWKEKWRDTTRKRRDANNEIKFEESIEEVKNKYESAYSLFVMQTHVNQNCFLGGRYYNGQTVAKLEHRLKHLKNEDTEINDIRVKSDEFKKMMTCGKSIVFNSDIMSLLGSKTLSADLIYLDPPYGGGSSDYANLYQFLEEYIYEQPIDTLEHIQNGGKRFAKRKGYQAQFEELLSLCNPFKTWMLSYNDSSYADLDTITSTIKNAGKQNIIVKQIPITYQYRKGKGDVDAEHFKDNFLDGGHKFMSRGIEYLILAQ